MDKIIKLCILFFGLNLIMPANSQIYVRFDNDCLFSNSLELGRAIMETIGENATRTMIKRNEKIMVSVEIDSLGRVSKILKSSFNGMQKKDTNRLLSNIKLRRRFYLCYTDGQEQKDIIMKGLRNDFQKNQKHSIALFFPGQFHEKYLFYKGKLTKEDYIIEKLKVNKR